MIALLSGFFVDMDHILDFHLNYGFSRSYKTFYDTMMSVDLRKIYLLFHSFELIILIWACILMFGLGKYWISLAIGMTQHLIFDRLTNPVKPGGYFLAFRIINKFPHFKSLQ